jgi:hypothetical protein
MIEAAPAGGKDGGPSLSRGVGAPLRGTEAGFFQCKPFGVEELRRVLHQ